MSFYNPYMQRPDYGQGIQDFLSQMFQMMMYKRYMDSMDSGNDGTEEVANGVPTSIDAGMRDQGRMFAQRHPAGYRPPLEQIPIWEEDPAIMQGMLRAFQQQMGGLQPRGPMSGFMNRPGGPMSGFLNR
jgi:hypothetical protein